MNFDRYGRLVDHPDAVTDDTAQLAVPTLNTASRALSTSKEGRVSACDGPGSTQGCKHTESRVVVSGESSVQADKKEEEEEDRPLTPSPTLFEKEMSALLGVGQRGCVTSLVTPGGVTKTSRGTGGKAATPEVSTEKIVTDRGCHGYKLIVCTYEGYTIIPFILHSRVLEYPVKTHQVAHWLMPFHFRRIS